MQTILKTEFPGLPLSARGKVRDIYDLGDRLLFVSTDRISAYDCVLPNGIPGKGAVLNLLSAHWMAESAAFVRFRCGRARVADESCKSPSPKPVLGNLSR